MRRAKACAVRRAMGTTPTTQFWSGATTARARRCCYRTRRSSPSNAACRSTRQPPALTTTTPGDPGYAKGPGEYFEGSSLGQVLAMLEMEPDETQRLLAAADHCLTAAYQGECPDIDPDELLFQRAAWRAKMSGRTLSDVIDGILDAAQRVKRHYDSEFGESVFLDPTEVPLDLPEGAAYAGRPVRYRALLPGGDLKEMLKGASPPHIERFMDAHAAAGRRVYGNPYRGYAGSYL